MLVNNKKRRTLSAIGGALCLIMLLIGIFSELIFPREDPTSNRRKSFESQLIPLNTLEQQRGRSALESDTDIGILGLNFVKFSDAHHGHFAEVRRIYPDTPAERSHLQEGDLITRVDDVPISNLTAGEVGDLLIDRPDTRVKLTIKRGKTEFNKVLTRMPSKQLARAHPDIWVLYSAQAPHIR